MAVGRREAKTTHAELNLRVPLEDPPSMIEEDAIPSYEAVMTIHIRFN